MQDRGWSAKPSAQDVPGEGSDGEEPEEAGSEHGDELLQHPAVGAALPGLRQSEPQLPAVGGAGPGQDGGQVQRPGDVRGSHGERGVQSPGLLGQGGRAAAGSG